jgi:hypothetical protein
VALPRILPIGSGAQGIGDELMRSLKDTMLGMWWISWFGFIGAFLFIGGMECKRELAERSAGSPFSVALLIVTMLAWLVFFLADKRAPNRERAVVHLLTTLGTVVTVFTVLGIFFFVDIAPRIP